MSKILLESLEDVGKGPHWKEDEDGFTLKHSLQKTNNVVVVGLITPIEVNINSVLTSLLLYFVFLVLNARN